MSVWIFYLVVAVSVLLLALLLVLIIRARGRVVKVGKALRHFWSGLRERRPIGELWTDLLELVTDLNTGPGGRYATPWLLLIGEPDSGRSRLLHALGKGDKAHPMSRLLRRTPRHNCWQVLDKGILIDAQQQEEGEAGLREVLQDLNQIRPERPVDGVVITLSANTLLSRNRERQRTVARHLHSLLWLLQKEVEFILPIYVVITQSDHIEGYRTFWQRFPQLQDQIFGWSSPYDLEARFQPEWVSEGVDHITRQLYNLQAAALAELSEQDTELNNARDFVLFPRRLAALEEQLTQLLAEVFDKTVYEAGASVRGFYFSGTMDRQSAPMGVAELARKKWFAEPNLAQPLRKAVWSRSRRLRRLQKISLWTLGGLFLSLAISAASLKHQTELKLETVRLLKAVEHQIGQTEDCRNPLPADDYFNLLQLISGIQDRAVYWNIPYSWFDSSVSKSTAQVIASGAFEDLIFPALRCRMQARAQELVKPAHGGDEDRVDRANASLYAYLSELLSFEHHLALYQRIVRYANANELESMREAFFKLTRYLYDRSVPNSLVQSDTAFARALLQVDYKYPMQLPDEFRNRVMGLLQLRSEELAEAMHEEVDEGITLLEHLSSGRQVSRAGAQLLSEWTNDVDQRWLGATAETNLCRDNWGSLNTALVRLERDYNYPAESLERVIAPFHTNRCDRPLLRQLETAKLQPFMRVLQQGDLGLNWDDGFADELERLRELLEQPFMDKRPTRLASCDGSMLVKREPITEALRFLRGYQLFISDTDHASLRGPKDLVAKLAAGQMEALVDERLSAALQAPPMTRTEEEKVERLSNAFAAASEELVTLVRLYKQLGLSLEDRSWYSCLNQTAAFELGAVDQLFQSSPLYLPALASENSPLLYRYTSDKARLTSYLEGELVRVQRLVKYARPYTRWFAEAAPDSDEAANERRYFWHNSVRQLDRDLQYNDANSQLALLRDYYQSNLVTLGYDNCSQQLQPPGLLDNDLFSERRQALYEEADLMCASRNEALLMADYQALAEAFNSRLAGYFPFANLGAPDLDPQRWQQFNRDYGDQLAALSKKVNSLNGTRWIPVQTFLQQIEQARVSLNPIYVDNKGAPVRLQTRFRSRPHLRDGVEQIVQWTLDTPNTRIRYPNGGDELIWRGGESISLGLQWAELSALRPRRDPSQQDMTVQDTLAQFRSEGPWALLRLVRAHRELVNTAQARAELRFRVPLKLTDTDGPPEGTADVSAPQSADARVSFNFAVQADDSGQWQPWQLAGDFPQQAPIIW